MMFHPAPKSSSWKKKKIVVWDYLNLKYQSQTNILIEQIPLQKYKHYNYTENLIQNALKNLRFHKPWLAKYNIKLA